MKDPHLTIGLAAQGGEPSLLMTRNDNELLNILNVELKHLNALGRLGANALVGESIFHMLNIAHAPDLAPFEELVPEDTQMHKPVDLVNYLIGQTKLLKTRKLIPAIEIALSVYEKELKGTPIPQQWPTFKAAFERLYPD